MTRIWGPITWYMMHTLASKINPTFYINNKDKIINIIKQICQGLPCPICKAHATKYTKILHTRMVPTKNHLIEYLRQFHNQVNSMSGKSLFHDVSKYEQFNIAKVFNSFLELYTNRSYPGQFIEGIKRRNVSKEIYLLLYHHPTMFQ